MIRIRRATDRDARCLTALADATFREAFAAVIASEDVDRHCRTHYREAVQAQEIADPDMLTLLAERGPDRVGFAQLRWAVAPACVVARSPGEIQRLYVARAWHGRGVAHALMDAALAALANRGSDVGWLGVWEHNPRAIAFYRKYGFREAGEHVFTLGTERQRDIVMARPVGDP